MFELYMMIGVPGSGKSTYIETIKRIYGITRQSYVVLSTDSYIEQKAQELGKTYNDIFFETIKEATKKLDEDLESAIKNGYNIIWDQTNLTVKSRKYKLAKIPEQYTKHAVVCKISYEDCIAVNNERKKIGRSIPFEVLSNMYNTAEYPSCDEDEGFMTITLARKPSND